MSSYMKSTRGRCSSSTAWSIVVEGDAEGAGALDCDAVADRAARNNCEGQRRFLEPHALLDHRHRAGRDRLRQIAPQADVCVRCHLERHDCAGAGGQCGLREEAHVCAGVDDDVAGAHASRPRAAVDFVFLVGLHGRQPPGVVTLRHPDVAKRVFVEQQALFVLSDQPCVRSSSSVRVCIRRASLRPRNASAVVQIGFSQVQAARASSRSGANRPLRTAATVIRALTSRPRPRALSSGSGVRRAIEAQGASGSPEEVRYLLDDDRRQASASGEGGPEV